jgi:hypothetical protein
MNGLRWDSYRSVCQGARDAGIRCQQDRITEVHRRAHAGVYTRMRHHAAIVRKNPHRPGAAFYPGTAGDPNEL